MAVAQVDPIELAKSRGLIPDDSAVEQEKPAAPKQVDPIELARSRGLIPAAEPTPPAPVEPVVEPAAQAGQVRPLAAQEPSAATTGPELAPQRPPTAQEALGETLGAFGTQPAQPTERPPAEADIEVTEQGIPGVDFAILRATTPEEAKQRQEFLEQNPEEASKLGPADASTLQKANAYTKFFARKSAGFLARPIMGLAGRLLGVDVDPGDFDRLLEEELQKDLKRRKLGQVDDIDIAAEGAAEHSLAFKLGGGAAELAGQVVFLSGLWGAAVPGGAQPGGIGTAIQKFIPIKGVLGAAKSPVKKAVVKIATNSLIWGTATATSSLASGNSVEGAAKDGAISAAGYAVLSSVLHGGVGMWRHFTRIKTEMQQARALLGVKWGSTPDEIRKVAGQRLLKLHPDSAAVIRSGGAKSEQAAREVIAARDFLLSKVKRVSAADIVRSAQPTPESVVAAGAQAIQTVPQAPLAATRPPAAAITPPAAIVTPPPAQAPAVAPAEAPAQPPAPPKEVPSAKEITPKVAEAGKEEGIKRPAGEEVRPRDVAEGKEAAKPKEVAPAAPKPAEPAKVPEVKKPKPVPAKKPPPPIKPEAEVIKPKPTEETLETRGGGFGAFPTGGRIDAAAKVLAGETKNAIRADTEKIVKEAVRTRKAKTLRDDLVATKWEKAVSESELEDIGADVEGVGNIRKGDTHKDVLKRMTPAMRKVKADYTTRIEQNRQEVNDHLRVTGDDEYIKFLSQYLPHFYVGGKKKVGDAVGGWVRKNSPNAKQRKVPTVQEAQKMGLKPLTQNIATLHRMWSRVNWQVATTRKLVSDLKTITDIDGTPTIQKASEAPVGEGWVLSEHPAVTKVFARRVGEKTVLHRGGVKIHPDAWRAIRQVLEAPLGGKFVNAIESFNAYAKKAGLSLSLFHHFSLTESAMATIGPRKGIFLFGKEAQPFGQKAIFTFQAGLKLLESPEFLEDITMSGTQIGASTDAQVGRIEKQLMVIEAKTRDIAGLSVITSGLRKGNRWWDRQLWDKYHRGLKAYAFYNIVQSELAKAPPNVSPLAVKEEVGRHINDAFGGQEWETMFAVSPRARQVLQMTMLAVDWTTSNARIAGRPVFNPTGPTGRLGRRYWRNMAFALFMSHAGLNYALNKKWPWENEEGHKTDIDVTPIIRKLPWSDPDDKQRHYVHFGKQAREVLGWITKPIMTLGVKLSPGAQVVIEQFSSHQAGAGFPAEWARDPFAGRNLKDTWWPRTKAVGRKFIPFSLRGNNFAFAAPKSKGMTPFKARRSMVTALRAWAEPGWFDSRATPRKLKDLVEGTIDAANANGHDGKKLFKQSLGRARSAYYHDVFDALVRGDKKDAEAAADSLALLNTAERGVLGSGKARGVPGRIRRKAVGELKRARVRLRKKRSE